MANINPSIKAILDYTTLVENTIQTKTPVNAVEAAVTIASATIAVVNNDDVITFNNIEYTKKASAAEDDEWEDATGLAAAITSLDEEFAAVESTGAVVITAATKGIASNEKEVDVEILEDTTENGTAEAKATATLAAATFARIGNGDTVTFDDAVFTKVAGDAGDDEFTDLAGLIALIDGLDDWVAVENAGAIDITAAVDGAEFNDIDLIVNICSETSGGINGTVGKNKEFAVDNTYLYVAISENTISGANWRRIAVGSVY